MRSATSQAPRCSRTRHFTKAASRLRSIAGVPGASFDARTVASVAYTDPEIAWMGLTETEARQSEIEYEKAVFPWAHRGGRSDLHGTTD